MSQVEPISAATTESEARGGLLECVPNISEGRDQGVIETLVARARDDEVELAHRTSDADHNRTVLTFFGTPAGLVRAMERLARASQELIDLRRHRGVHPRLGVLDVLPFVPVGGQSMSAAIEAARAAGERIARSQPVFFYEHAARRHDRRDLAAHRRGGLDHLAKEMRERRISPDLGPADVEPSSGVVLVGARGPLIAFNVQLAAADPRIAKRIAARIRQRAKQGGGVPGVKALGLPLPTLSRSQVSMNIVEPHRVDLHALVDRIAREAANEGTQVVTSELIGLMPRANARAGAEALRLPSLSPEQLIETHLERVQRRLAGLS